VSALREEPKWKDDITSGTMIGGGVGALSGASLTAISALLMRKAMIAQRDAITPSFMHRAMLRRANEYKGNSRA